MGSGYDFSTSVPMISFFASRRTSSYTIVGFGVQSIIFPFRRRATLVIAIGSLDLFSNIIRKKVTSLKDLMSRIEICNRFRFLCHVQTNPNSDITKPRTPAISTKSLKERLWIKEMS